MNIELDLEGSGELTKINGDGNQLLFEFFSYDHPSLIIVNHRTFLA